MISKLKGKNLNESDVNIKYDKTKCENKNVNAGGRVTAWQECWNFSIYANIFRA